MLKNKLLSAMGGAPANYIEECFSTYLYTGNGSTQTITNGIDLAGEGGMVWLKARTSGGSSFTNHAIIDTARGANANGYYSIYPNLTESQFSPTGSGDAVATATSATGFTVGGNANVNYNTQTDVSWTFRKQPKFFDVVTFSGTGSAQTIAHNLGSVPGCIIVKNLDAATNWAVYHRSLGGTYITRLNRDWAPETGYENWANTDPTSTVFTVGNGNATNGSGYNYVAYVFAHNAGGFGLTGTDNVISCGSFSTDGNGKITAPVNLGYEAQWVLVKNSGSAENWVMYDIMRGMNNTGYAALNPNTSGAEYTGTSAIAPTATGFNTPNASGPFASFANYIYIAIRRGPMKVPTSGTSVFLPTSRTGNASLTTVTSGFAPDVVIGRRVDTLDNGNESVFADKLRGSGTLSTNNTDAEYAGGATSGLNSYTNTGVVLGTNNSPIYAFNYSGLPYALYQFQRAPNFMDEVCYTGTGAGDNPRTFTHNLQVVPELMIIKRRNSTAPWIVYSASQGASKYANLNTTDAFSTADEYLFNNTSPTASVFTVGSPNGASSYVNASGGTYVNYLFATCAGVSKVGSYTGTGATQTISCGFTGGARFVLIKRTDSTGNWYVWDTARGMVSGTDPKFGMNLTTAQTNADWVYTATGGFQIVTSDANVNASGGTYIFLAIA